jgi:DNA-binding NtrC family response regulator
VLRAGKAARLEDLPDAIRLHARTDAPRPASVELLVSLDDSLDASVSRILDAAIDLEGGNRSRAARRLGVSLRTIQRHAAIGRTTA